MGMKITHHPNTLWFSITTPGGVFLEYELPNDEKWFTQIQWRQYQELNELAAAHCVAVHVTAKSERPK